MTIKAYLYGGFLLVVAALVATTFYYRGNAIDAIAQLATAEANLATVVKANQDNVDTIARITTLREQNEVIMTDLLNITKAIQDKQAETATAVNELSKTDVSVKAYLDTPVPANLGRLLNNK